MLTQPGDLIMLVNEQDRKRYIRTLEPGKTLYTHRGYLDYDDLIGVALGSTVRTHLGYAFHLLTPTTDELIRSLRRESQIIFPKDAGYIIMKLGIAPGSQVAEAGTGSGGLTTALAIIVGDSGRVYSYDIRRRMQDIARSNLARLHLGHRVEFRLRDVSEGFELLNADAVFLDLLMPWGVLDAARNCLRGGGMLGCLVPTINQLQELVVALRQHPGFGLVEVEELILRPYRTAPARIRPEDKIVGHTGYLIFSRAVTRPTEAVNSIAPSQGASEENLE